MNPTRIHLTADFIADLKTAYSSSLNPNLPDAPLAGDVLDVTASNMVKRSDIGAPHRNVYNISTAAVKASGLNPPDGMESTFTRDWFDITVIEFHKLTNFHLIDKWALLPDVVADGLRRFADGNFEEGWAGLVRERKEADYAEWRATVEF